MSRYSVEAILSVKGAERFRQAFDNASRSVERMERVSGRIRDVSQRIGSVGSNLTNKITKPAIVATGALAGVVGALGFKRLVGMDNAQAKLKGLGVEGKQLEQVMSDVDAAVTGTTHTMAEGADVAAGALAAGVKEGEELERYIKLVGDAATGANVPMSEMAQIFNRVQGTGKLTRHELNQIEHRLPGFSQSMMKHVGADSLDAFHDMVTAGKVGSEDLLDVMDDFAGGMSDAMAGTWQGIASRVLSNIGILGEKVLDGLFEDGKKAMSNFVEVLRSDEVKKRAEEIGESLRNMVNKVVDVIKGLKQQYDDLNPAIQDMIKKFALIAPIVAVATGPILKFVGWIGTLTAGIISFGGRAAGAFRIVGAAIGGISAPVWIAIGVVTALVGALVLVWNKSEAFREGVTSAFEAVRETVVNAIGHISDFIQEVFGFVVDWWIENKELIATTAENVWQRINDKIETVMTYVVPVITEAWEFIKLATELVWEKIKLAVMIALELIGGIITATMHIINGDWDKAWEEISDTFSKIWDRMKEYGDRITTIINDYIEEKLDQAKRFVRDKWEEAKQYFIDKFNEMKDSAIKKGQEIVQSVKDKFEDAKQAVSDKLEEAKTAVSDKIGEIPSIITDIGPKLFDAGANIIGSLISGIKSRFGSIGSVMGDVGGRIRNFLPFSPAKEGPLKDIMRVRISESIAEAIDRGKGAATRAMANLASAMDGELSLNRLDAINTELSSDIAHEVEATVKQPAYIVVRVGNSEFVRFVEDITEVQDRNAKIIEDFR